MKLHSMFIGVCLSACSTQAAVDPQLGNAELGISEFRVAETEGHLAIDGIDASGNVRASAHLRVGYLDIEEDQIAGVGRELVVQVNGRQVTHESVGLDPLSLPELPDASLNSFLRDPFVADALSKWDIALADRSEVVPELSITDYSHNGSCSAFPPSCSGSGYTSCCLEHADGNGNRKQYAVCGNTYPVANVAQRSCKAPGAATACGTAGAAGCATCWIVGYDPLLSYGYAWWQNSKCHYYIVPLGL